LKKALKSLQRKEASTMARALKYPPDMKERAVRLVHDSGSPISHVARGCVGYDRIFWPQCDGADSSERRNT
jgi:hypothetical protein